MVDKERVKESLWGLFVGDSLSMPAHWYYNLATLKKAFPNGIETYYDAPHPHPESFMAGMGYFPDVQTAQKLDREYDITHEHSRFYKTNYSEFGFTLDSQEGEHGNSVASEEQRFHYHHDLKAGENTLAAHLVRVLLRSVVKEGGYDPYAFMQDFVAFLTTKDTCKDPYKEEYIRHWFENYTKGYPLLSCASNQQDIWSIGSHGGLIRALVVSLFGGSSFEALGIAVEHQNLTHRSQNISSALGSLIPFYQEVLTHGYSKDKAEKTALSLNLPKVKGEELFALYRQHNGPGNIDKKEMFDLHTTFEEKPFNIKQFSQTYTHDEVVRTHLANACYTEHGVPLLMYLGYQTNFSMQALYDNAMAGGDNVHRGMVLGLLVGASTKIDEGLKKGLTNYEELKKEIESFVALL